MAESATFEPRRRARRRALQALYQWRINRRDMGEIVREFLQEQDFSNVDRDLFESLCRGISASADELDKRLGDFVDRPLRRLDVIERVILHIGAWELLKHREDPTPVILDECVDLAHRFGAEQGHAFVNAILDRAAQQWRPDEASPAGAMDE
ncbi:MAG: transcription antitermination factor NusB [Xanthomonadales bacterium]|nr:transcription antitermination factor NusB [Xanthomonadales bacterium]